MKMLSLTDPHVLCMCVTHMGSCTWNRPALLWSTLLSSHRRWRCFSEVSVLEQPDRCRKLSLLYTPDHTTSSDTVPKSPTGKHKGCETVCFLLSCSSRKRDHRSPVQCFLSTLFLSLDETLQFYRSTAPPIGSLYSHNSWRTYRNHFLHFIYIFYFLFFTSFT